MDKPKATKKHVYRVGDKVRILRPNWIARVGYPLIWTDLRDEVEADPRTAAALIALGFGGYEHTMFGKPKNIPREFVRAVAMMRVEQRGFGGKERQLILEQSQYPVMGDYVGFGMNVISKRTVRTGTYYPPTSYHWSSPDGDEYDSEPGGLIDAKTHVLLKLDRGEISTADVEPW